MILSGRPAPHLKGFVRYYYQVRDRLGASGAFLQPVPARSPQILEFMFGRPFQVQRLTTGVVEHAKQIALVGAQTFRRVNLLLSEEVDAFTIAFAPGGLAALFPVAVVELTDGDFDGRAALGATLGELQERLAAETDFNRRVDVADRFLSRRASASRPAGAGVWAAHEIQARRGWVNVGDLAAETSLSMRQFERRFRADVGMGPKFYARVIRFEAALRLKRVRPGRRWTDVAQELGYFDQMHMVHDFQRLSGAAPSLIGDQLDMFVKPEVSAGPEAYSI